MNAQPLSPEVFAFGLLGLVAGWLVVAYSPWGWAGAIAAVTLALAVGGRLMFEGVLWALGAGLVLASLLTFGREVAGLF